MKICLENIGKIKEAEIVIDSVTVVAGVNDTGKSTVGKALYGLFNGMNNLDSKMNDDKYSNVRRVVVQLLQEGKQDQDNTERENEIRECCNKLLKTDTRTDNTEEHIASILDHLVNAYEISDSDAVSRAIERIKGVLDLNDGDVMNNVLTMAMNAEFGGCINNLYQKKSGIIELYIKNYKTRVTVAGRDIKVLDRGIQLNTEAVYIDDPGIIDRRGGYPVGYVRNYTMYNHEDRLRFILFEKKYDESIIAQMIADTKINILLDKIKNAYDGEIAIGKNWAYEYHMPGVSEAVNMRNVSAGIKIFALIRVLMEKGVIYDQGVLIMDEPEIHLHPEWQLLLAEIIILLQKEFKLHVLINTHSPYFLYAIEVFSKKYDINRTKYYIAEEDDNNSSVIRDVGEDIDLIYKKLARPFQKLEDMRWEDEEHI